MRAGRGVAAPPAGRGGQPAGEARRAGGGWLAAARLYFLVPASICMRGCEGRAGREREKAGGGGERAAAATGPGEEAQLRGLNDGRAERREAGMGTRWGRSCGRGVGALLVPGCGRAGSAAAVKE